jgi:small subunit ribosomal protein S4
MGRYIKSSCKKSRRIGLDLNLKSISGRDITTKCKLKVLPGQHGSKKKKTSSNHALQLSAKQMIKYTYGVLEKQFKHFYKRVSKKKGASGEFLLKMLESRLDNVVYRMGFAVTRSEARQLVAHKSIIVIRDNFEKIITCPSFLVKAGDKIKIKDKSKKQIRINYALKCAEKIGFVKWVETDIKCMSSSFIRLPERNELSNDFKEQLVVEFYSK